jgi:hypothetical protein
MESKCQACGFRVFNRLYPKCESCGIELATDLALSPLKRRELFEQDRVTAELAWREKQKVVANALIDPDGGLGLVAIAIATGSS